jgi:hypothetical protein
MEIIRIVADKEEEAWVAAMKENGENLWMFEVQDEDGNIVIESDAIYEFEDEARNTGYDAVATGKKKQVKKRGALALVTASQIPLIMTSGTKHL